MSNNNGSLVRYLNFICLFFIVILSVFFAGTIEVHAAEDTTPPIIKSISANKLIGRPDETIEIIVEAEDNLSGIQNTLQLAYQLPDNTGTTAITLTLNTDGKYYAYFPISTDSALGVWKVSDIFLEDKAGNSTIVFNSEIYPSYPNNMDLSGGDFEIQGPDITPPKIKSISVDKNYGVSGDIINFVIEATDDISGIKGRINIGHESGRTQSSMWTDLNADGTYSTDGIYSKRFSIPASWISGDYKLRYLSLQDIAGNSIVVYNSELYPNEPNSMDLSGGDFRIGYTITFDSQGGSAIEAKTINSHLIVAPSTPTRTGYAFGGWYKEPECINAWNFNTDIANSDVTLYAKWTLNNYWVMFNSQGGSVVPLKMAKYDTKIGVPTDPTKTGYTFEGWYKEPEYINEWNFDFDKVTSNTTLYANWAEESRFFAKSLSLNGRIAINYYLKLSEADVANNPSLTLRALNHPDITLNLSDAILTTMNGINCYKFTYDQLAAKEMSDVVTATISVGGAPVDTLDYSVTTYAAAVLADTNASESLKNVIYGMLNYGSAAQMYFNYNTGNLANSIEGMSGHTDVAYADGVFDSYINSELGEGIIPVTYASSLILEADTTFRVYVTSETELTKGYQLRYNVSGSADYTYGNLTNAGNNRYYVDISGIAAKNLNAIFEVTVVDNNQIVVSKTKTCSPFGYARLVMNDAIAPVNLKNLMPAMNSYYTAAANYFSLQ